MKNVLKPSILIILSLTAAASATDAAIHNKMFGSSRPLNLALHMTTFEEMNDIKNVNSLGESGLLTKGINKTIKNKAKEQKGGFLGMLFYILGASLLGNLVVVKVQLQQVKA